MAIANGSQSAHKFTTWSVLLQKAKDKNADIMIISEPGRKATEQAIRWGTHIIGPRETATRARRKKIGASNKAGMPYQVYVTPGQPGEGERGGAGPSA